MCQSFLHVMQTNWGATALAARGGGAAKASASRCGGKLRDGNTPLLPGENGIK
jgi:hypothetical protein